MAAASTTSAELLAHARGCRQVADRAEADLMVTTVAWASLHPDRAGGPVVADSFGPGDTVLSGPSRGEDQPLEVAGPGAPTVSELALVEYAAVLAMTTDAGARYVGDAIELAHRLPRIYARVAVGELLVWRARRIAQATRDLSPAAAADLDAALAPLAHRVGDVTLGRLVEETRARVDPEEAELKALEAAETRHATLHRTPAGSGTELAGLAEFTATLDLPDAHDLDTAVSDLAEALKAAGDADTLPVRRARALGLLARGHRPTPHHDAASPASGPVGRAVTLYVHTTAETLATPTPGPVGGLDLARLEPTGAPVTAELVREWLGRPDTHITVKPVIDLRDHLAVDAYEIPDRIAERVRLARHTCAFPYCTRPARSADLDHTSAYVSRNDGGPPGQTGTHTLAPLCRRHHRAKTHPAPTGSTATGPARRRRWRYRRDPDDPAAYLWTSPHGHPFRVDPHGTTQLSGGLSPTAPVP